MSFDEVLPTFVRVCETSDAFADIERWCAVRDLRGRVRLVVEPKAAGLAEPRRQRIEDALVQALGRYFGPPTWSTRDPADRGRLARAVLEQALGWPDAAYDDPASGVSVGARGQWLRLERRLSKLDWMERGAPKPPWGLDTPMPAVVTFYSFKGGVGRTTSLAACAWQLAQAGARVAVVDLDLEAPGLGTLLEAETRRGVLDFIVDHLATGSNDLHETATTAQVFGAEAPRVQVFPAGRLDRGYLDKLARLDFAASTHGAPHEPSASPVGAALRSLLQAIGSQKPRPDFVLLDSRAGLHDLAGLSLHGLAHVDVLFCRAGEQGYRGLDLALATLAQRRSSAELLPLVVHALAPAKGTPEARQEEPEFLARVYDIFRERVYARTDVSETDLPPKESAIGIHSPHVLRFNAELLRFTRLADRREILFGEDYAALRQRLEELCRRDGTGGGA